MLGLWLARGPLLGPLVARVAASTLTEATGGRAHIAGATGGWFGDARLDGIELHGPGWSVRARQVEADYGLGLLRGDVSALRAVTVSGVEATLDVDALPASAGPPVWPDVLARLPATLPDLRLDGTALLRVGGQELRIEGLDLTVTDGMAELRTRSLTFAGRRYELPPVRLRRRTPETLSLDQPLDLPFPSLRCEHLELSLGTTVRQLRADGRLAGGTWQARLAAGELSVEVHGVDAVALGLLPPDRGPVLVDARVEQVADGWALRALHVTAAGLTLDGSALVQSAPWRCRDLAATLSADLSRLLPTLQGQVQATLRGGVPLDRALWPQGSLALSVTGSSLVAGGTACTPLRLEAQLEDGAIRLQALEGGWGGVEATLGVEVRAGETPAIQASPLRGSDSRTSELPAGSDARIAGVPPAGIASPPGPGWHLLPRPIGVAGGVITLEARGGVDGSLVGDLCLADLPLAQLPFVTGLRHLKGTASGSMHLDGSLSAPTWTGALRLDGVEAKLSADIPTFAAGRARLTVEPGLLTIEELRGELGGAELTIAGRVRPGAGDDALALTCTGRNLLLLQRPDARVRADLDLRLGGPISSPLLSGEVLVVSALITPELHGGGTSAAPGDDRIVLFELPDPPLSTLRFAVQVRSTPDTSGDRGVRVVTRWGRGLCDLDLRLGGTGALPAPEGRVTVREGVATLPFSTLKVTHGELVFPPGDPFEPRLAATAGARIRTYDVQAQVTGTLAQPVVRVTGGGLDEQDAMMLLTTGSTSRELQDPQTQKAALGRVGVWLGQEAWRDLEDLDGIDDGPSLSERLVITWGRERSDQGRDTIDSEVELTEPGSHPSVLLYGERDRWDQYNAGLILRLSWGGEEP